ncbi:adenylate/guanylate cyclase domain-containing protein [Thermodesulfobacteriota bacterium]
MKKRSRYRLYTWLMILSGLILAITLVVTSLKIILGGKKFTQLIIEENKAFVSNTLRFGHGMMAHMGSTSYDDLISLALKSKFIQYLAVYDEDGRIIAQGQAIPFTPVLQNNDLSQFQDEKILRETENLLFISYRAEKEIVPDEEHMKHHMTFKRNMQVPASPEWFIVGLDVSAFRKHYRDMVIQTAGTGTIFFLFGILIIIFFGIVQRYELAHLSIEKLHKIKRLLGHFVPETAKNLIENEPDKKGLLDKYIQDATILFLDIEGFSLLVRKYSQKRINRTIESYFSIFLDLIKKNDGDINETAGDGMMIIFLHPDPDHHARNAIQTALEIEEQCLRRDKEKDYDLFPIQVNIGIQSGEVYLGSTKMRGTEGERWTFTASGTVTIMAARLAQYARNGQIIIGEETAKRIKEYFSMQSLGKVPLKNIEDSGDIYQITK